MRFISIATAALVAACGGEFSLGGADAGADGAAADGAAEAGGDAATDAAVDAPLGDVKVAIIQPTATEDCQPIIAPDPVSLAMTLELDNTGTVVVGPVSVPGGRVLDMNGVELMTFAATAAPSSPIAPGTSVMMPVQKTPNSGRPQNHCQTLPCGGQIRIEIRVTGPGIAPGTKAVSDLVQVGCAA